MGSSTTVAPAADKRARAAPEAVGDRRRQVVLSGLRVEDDADAIGVRRGPLKHT
jgi:hypothetical protein